MSVREEQQKIIAYAFYQKRIKAELDTGSQDGDWNMADKILKHFETPYKDQWWEQDEEDFNGFRDELKKEYLEYVRLRKERFDTDTCSD